MYTLTDSGTDTSGHSVEWSSGYDSAPPVYDDCINSWDGLTLAHQCVVWAPVCAGTGTGVHDMEDEMFHWYIMLNHSYTVLATPHLLVIN